MLNDGAFSPGRRGGDQLENGETIFRQPQGRCYLGAAFTGFGFRVSDWTNYESPQVMPWRGSMTHEPWILNRVPGILIH
ncbi:MAG: hypothetical protein OSB44_12550 [Verrucomicrobiales bacterium]|nr:hypothetical protein [Verrucomicrobiales bacterium]